MKVRLNMDELCGAHARLHKFVFTYSRSPIRWLQMLRQEPIDGRYLPKLPETHRRTCFGFCRIRTRGLHGYQRRDNQVRFHAGKNPPGFVRGVAQP
jgi:hypothetical protein